MEKKFMLIKRLITGLLLTLSFTANATTYYFSASGNDANAGTSASASWKSIAKFNSVFASKSPGDNFLFNRGDVFYGMLVIGRSGSAGNPITIGAYGTGANPVITGFTTVSTWTSLGSNIWESTSALDAPASIMMVAINGVNTPMGRYPNTGYLTYQSFSGNTQITSSSLTGSTNWTGADAIIRKQRWIIDRNRITGQSGSTLTYTPSSTYNGQANYGFFIQNDSRTLDLQNEWYYNPSTKKIRIYSAASPTNVKVATKDTLVMMKYRNYITFDGVSFQGSNKDGFVILSSANVTIQNCSIDYSGTDAIWGNQNWGQPSSNFVLKNSIINHTNNNAIFLADEFKGALISNNVFRNTGMIVGMGGNGDGMYEAIQTRADNAIVEYNEIDSSGYVGIGFFNNGTIIRNNLVNGFNYVKLDGAGIYTWIGTGNSPFTGQKVLNNIVMNGFGDNSGTTATGNPISHGIYMDDWSANVEIAGNTVANCPHSGIYLHKAHDLNVHNNTSFNNGQYQLLMVSSDAGSLIRNDIVKNNIFFSKAAAQLVGGFQSLLDDIRSFGTIDSNYYTRPISESTIFNVTINNYASNFSYTLAQWQAYAGFDTHSKKAPKTVTTVNDIRFEYNASTSNKTVTLDGNYIDVKNVSYNGSITLAPYTSAILIRNGAATNQAPKANAGVDQTIVLPTTAVSLSGSGTDNDGSITAYLWTKISGPAAGAITTATAAATTATALAQGVYKFQLKVTDNAGATGLDTVQITVNPAGNVPPTANAGADQTITLPTSSVTISGSGADPGGSISAYLWTKVSGPASGTITNATAAATTVTALAQGVYKFQLRVTDNGGATAFDTVQVTVNAAGNVAPTANAGADQTITLPTSSVSLAGSGSDPGGSITAYLWTKVSGPTGGTITSATAAATTVTGLTQGVYIFQLKVTDNSTATGVDNVQVTVNAAGGTLLPAVNPANTVNGLDYKYYEATAGWSYMPIFSNLTPIKTGAATGFNLALANRTTRFAFYFSGFVNVPADGQYTFYTTSDDGSYLSIDGRVVVNNDGLHGTTEKSGTIGLKAGKHAIAVGYFQQDGGSILTVEYSSPALARAVIPAARLYRISTAGLATDISAGQTISAASAQVAVKVFPNPFADHIGINITGGSAGTYKMTMVDVAGRILWTKSGIKNAGDFQQSVNTSSLERGTYFIKVIQNDTHSIITLVK